MSTKSITTILLITSSTVLSIASSQCDISIEAIQNSYGKYTITLAQDPRCDITIKHDHSRITLTSKPLGTSNQTHTTRTHNQIIHPATTNQTIEDIISLAKSKLGNSYEPAAAGPDHFDCSGFVYYVFTSNGIKIPRTSRTQSESGEKIPRKDLRRGDMVFFDTHHRNHVNHSGIYLGDGRFIHSSSGRVYGVTISDIDHGFYRDKFRWGVRKVETSQ